MLLTAVDWRDCTGEKKLAKCEQEHQGLAKELAASTTLQQSLAAELHEAKAKLEDQEYALV